MRAGVASARTTYSPGRALGGGALVEAERLGEHVDVEAGVGGEARSRRRRVRGVSSAGEPSAARRPPVMIATRSHSVSASSIACVVSSTVTPRSRRSRTRSHVVARACGSMPAVGSSRNTTRGRPMSAHASERRCAWPPESRRTGVRDRVAQPDEVEHRLGCLGGLVVRREQPEQLERPQPGIQAAGLQHHADLRAELPAVAHRVEAEHAHRAGVGPAVALEDLDRRRLARAVGAEQAEHLARARPRSRASSTARVAPYDLLEPGDARLRERRSPPLRSPATRRSAASSSSHAARGLRAVVPPRARRGPRRRAVRSRPRRRRRAPVRTNSACSAATSDSREVGRSELREQLAIALGRAGARDRDQRRGLALAQVVADRLAGDRALAERAEHVVAELERLAHRQSDRRERRRPARRSGPASAAPRCSGRSTVYLPDL